NGIGAKAAHGPGGRVRYLVDRAAEALQQRVDSAGITHDLQLPHDRLSPDLIGAELAQHRQERLKASLTLRPQHTHRRKADGARTCEPEKGILTPRDSLDGGHDTWVAIAPQRLERCLDHTPLWIVQQRKQLIECLGVPMSAKLQSRLRAAKQVCA